MELYDNKKSESDLVPNDEAHNGEDKHEKERRKRRSKNDPSGRQYKCEICGKTYLSRPALSQHIKTKHQDRIGEYKRGRGRPRKNNEDVAATINNSKYNDFFNRPICSRSEVEENYHYQEELKSSIKELYTRFQKVLNPDCKEIEKEHGLMKITINPDNDNKDPKLVTYDESILRYLNEASKKVNRHYYDFICKFCVLFRESFNIVKKEDNEQGDYSSKHNAEEVPDKCNNFIADFMEQYNYFELDSNEVIEIIQHFCHWLYEKSYTTSVLSLM